MAGLRWTVQAMPSRIEHLGSVVTVPALLEQRRAERAARLRLARAAAATIAAAGDDLVEQPAP